VGGSGDEILVLMPVQSGENIQVVFQRGVEECQIGQCEKANGIETRFFDAGEFDLRIGKVLFGKWAVGYGFEPEAFTTATEEFPVDLDGWK